MESGESVERGQQEKMFLEEWLNRQTGARRDGRTPSSTTAISRILIANNGMAAVKCIRSIRRWAYEELANERSIQFTAMATPEDIRNNAEYVRMSDAYVEVPGGSSNNNYSNVDLIVEIAERTGTHFLLLISFLLSFLF